MSSERTCNNSCACEKRPGLRTSISGIVSFSARRSREAKMHLPYTLERAHAGHHDTCTHVKRSGASCFRLALSLASATFTLKIAAWLTAQASGDWRRRTLVPLRREGTDASVIKLKLNNSSNSYCTPFILSTPVQILIFFFKRAVHDRESKSERQV